MQEMASSSSQPSRAGSETTSRQPAAPGPQDGWPGLHAQPGPGLQNTGCLLVSSFQFLDSSHRNWLAQGRDASSKTLPWWWCMPPRSAPAIQARPSNQATSRAWDLRRLARSTRATGTWAAKHRLPTGFQYPVSGLQLSKLAGPRQRRQLEDSVLVVYATVGTSDTRLDQPRYYVDAPSYDRNRDLKRQRKPTPTIS